MKNMFSAVVGYATQEFVRRLGMGTLFSLSMGPCRGLGRQHATHPCAAVAYRPQAMALFFYRTIESGV